MNKLYYFTIALIVKTVGTIKFLEIDILFRAFVLLVFCFILVINLDIILNIFNIKTSLMFDLILFAFYCILGYFAETNPKLF